MASAGRHSSRSSSGGRSTTISPSTPASSASAMKAFDAVAVDRVVVPHQDDWRFGLGLPEPADHGQRPAQGHAGLERAQRCLLDRRAVRHRVGERHAELDQVGPGLRQACQDLEGGLLVRVAGGQEGDQTAPTLGLQRVEPAPDAVGAGRGSRGPGGRLGGRGETDRWPPSQVGPQGVRDTVEDVLVGRGPANMFITIRWSDGTRARSDHVRQRVRRLQRRQDAFPAGHRAGRRRARPGRVALTYVTRPMSCSQACSGPIPG